METSSRCSATRNVLSDAMFQAVYDLGMRVLRASKHEFVVFQHVDQAGVALHQRGGKFDHAAQDFANSVRCA